MIHSGLVLCPTCVPGKLGINKKNDISIRNNGIGRG
jgi:hypothetical protein